MGCIRKEIIKGNACHFKKADSTVENPVSACPKGEGQESNWENL